MQRAFQTAAGRETEIARAPANRGKNYPNCEAVLINCALEGITPAGWGPVGGDTSNVHYWEYNSSNISDGKPVDVRQRRPYSRQLTREKDAEIIANYSNPAYVLGGWTPSMEPIILSQLSGVITAAGHAAVFDVKVAAIPAVAYQWFKNGTAIRGAKSAILKIERVRAKDAGVYTVTVVNESGSATSRGAVLTLR